MAQGPRKNFDEEFKGLKNAQKAALLMIALGQRWATEIMRLLKEEEVRKISYWISQTKYVHQELTEKVIAEFYNRLNARTSLASSGGRDYLSEVLTGMMGESKAKDLMNELLDREENEVFKILKHVDPKQLAAYLKQEQPQTIALMLAYLDPVRSASIIAALPVDSQVEIISRMARLEETDPDVISAMEDALQDSLSSVTTGKKMLKMGGSKTAAEILNYLPAPFDKDVLEKLSEDNFDLAAEIKELMFVFDDVYLLDDKSIQAVMKDVEQADLILALKGSRPETKEKIFQNVSKRQAESINDELAFMGPVKASAVLEAQNRIVGIIRKLDEEGKILIQGKGGGDEIIS